MKVMTFFSGAKFPSILLILVAVTFCACGGEVAHGDSGSSFAATEEGATAVFAGGCFWCMEGALEKIDGINAVVSGFSGGKLKDPSYKAVSSGATKHLEVVKVYYNPKVVSYEALLWVFWMNIDPTDAGGQFADRGHQYSTAVFYGSEAERAAAEKTKKTLASLKLYDGKKLVTSIRKKSPFYRAEQYHQDYYKKEPAHYQRYRRGSGREAFLLKVWKGRRHPNEAKFAIAKTQVLKSKLAPLDFDVTQKDGTERAFTGRYWDNKKAGIYVDVVSGEALFSSNEKFESGTGWPSFRKALDASRIVEKSDIKFGMRRVEVRSRYADSHLGHVFDDGPKPSGLRYCINGAALRFIPRADMAKRGYGEYLSQVAKK